MDQNLGPAMVKHVGKTRGLLADADRNGNGSQPQYREQQGGICAAIAEEERDSVTACHTQLCQGCRPPIDDFIEASVAEALFSADDGFPVGIGRHRLGKKCMRALWPNRKTGDDTVIEVPLRAHRGYDAKPPRQRLQRRTCRASHQTTPRWQLTSASASPTVAPKHNK